MPTHPLNFPNSSMLISAALLFCGLANPGFVRCSWSQEEPSGDSSFQAEFKKIFGTGPTADLTAVEYLEKLVAGESNDQEFKRQIQLLGSEEYVERQNAEGFLFSVPVLPEKYRVFAAESADMEVRYRLNSIFLNRKTRVESLVIAALRTVGEKKNTTALENVFKVLVSAESAKIKGAASQVVHSIATKEHRALLQHQLRAESADVRLLAATLMVQIGVESAVDEVVFLLDDQEDRVRLGVAKLLVDQGRKPGILTLIRLLECDSISIATRSERVLRAVTGEEFGYISYSDKSNNAKVSQAWNRWREQKLATIKLRLPIKDFLKTDSRLNGHTLIAKNQNLVVELDSDRKEIFRLPVDGVLSAEKTPEGNYLLFSYTGRWLKEYNPQKKINWEMKGVKFNNAMPLANGNVLVSVGPGSLVQEINPATKKTVWEFNTNWWPNDAYRLENGNTLVGGKGGVIEVTPDRKIVWEYKNPETATIVVAKPTENNAVLVGWTSGLAKEINKEKKTIWEHKVKSLSDVFRDANGHTFFATATEIIELDRDKKTIWKTTKQAKTATIRR